MKGKLLSLVVLLFVTVALFGEKPKLMWIDCSANWERFSYPDSIKHYVKRCKDAGITALVLDIKGTSSELNYKSRYAPHKTEWKGFKRADFDYVEAFLVAARENGLKIYGSFNIFAEGHGLFKKGLVYTTKQHWQSMNYLPEKGVVPSSQIEGKAVIFSNPALPEVQEHILNILKETLTLYPLDGIILDRTRYDNITADFSEFSKNEFEKYIGEKVNRFPQDIFEWVKGQDGNYIREEGVHFKKWIEWRASVIYNFFVKARMAVKEVDSSAVFGAYTGAWYPTYYEVGVNWASKDYDASKDFKWATPEYKNYGYAHLLDLYTNGNYYYNVTLEEYRKSEGYHKNETDSELSSGEHLCVEGACIYSRKLLGNNPFLGGIYVEDYKNDSHQFMRAVEMNLKKSDGLMIFDIVHIIRNGWWEELTEAIAKSCE